MHLGIGSYTFTWAVGVPGQRPVRPLTALDVLKRAHDLGLRVAQFCDNLPLTALGRDEFEQFRDFAREHGMAIELGTRGTGNTANLLAHLDLARRLGSPFVRLVLDAQGDEPTPEEAVSRLRPLLARFTGANIKLALENHDRFSCRTLVRIVEELGSEQVGICLDTVNSFGALEGPEVVVETLGPYALNLHIKDFTIARVSSQMGFVVNGCAAGHGRLNVPWLLERLKTFGREPNAILELWTPFGPTLEETIARENHWAQESVRYLRQFIPE
jgi:3-oxoisoapionate decarboxylase